MLLKNLRSSFFLKIIILFLSLVIIPVVINYAGVVVYGEYVLYMAIINLFLFFNTGFAQFIIKELNANHKKQESYAKITMCGLSVFLIISGLFLFYFFLKEEGGILVILLWINLFLLYIQAFYSAYLSSFELIFLANRAELLMNISRSMLLIVFSILYGSIDAIFVALLISNIFTIGLLLYFVSTRTSLKPFSMPIKATYSDFIFIFRSIILYSVNEFVWRLFSTTDKILVQKFLGTEAVAIYNIAYTASIRLLEVSGIFAQVAYPRFMRVEKKQLKRIFYIFFFSNMAFVFSQNLFVYNFSNSLITLWVGAHISESASPILNIMLIGGFFGGLNYVLNPYMISVGLIKKLVIFNLISILFYYMGVYYYYEILKIKDLKGFAYSYGIYFFSLFSLTSMVLVFQSKRRC